MGKADVPHFLISVGILLPCAASRIVAINPQKVVLGHKNLLYLFRGNGSFSGAGAAVFIFSEQ